MNLIEKAKLASELSTIIDELEHRALTFFEIAKSKKRIKDIIQLCDEPIFRKQIIEFKAQYSPFEAAQAFVEASIYSLSFRGTFQSETDLEETLYQQPHTGWAILHLPASGWQIWLIPAPNRTALISEWGQLTSIYLWLLEQQKIYHCLQTDTELKKQLTSHHLPILSVSDAIEFNIEAEPLIIYTDKDAAQQQPKLDLSPNPDMLSPNSIEESSNIESIPDLTVEIQPDSSICVEESIAFSYKTQQQEEQPSLHIPETIHFGEHSATVHKINQQELNLQQHVYALKFEHQIEIHQYLDILYYATNHLNWNTKPVFIAEQIDAQGCFIKYLAIIGAEDEMQAIRLTQNFSQYDDYEIAAIKTLNFENFSSHLHQLDHLYMLYIKKAQLVWNIDNYYAYIPAQLIHTHKFIHFEEPEADFRTPLLLLKERQKIRIIHGENRFALSSTEKAYPYLLLDRNQGISWQLIQNVITDFEPPISVLKLYEAIQQHIEN